VTNTLTINGTLCGGCSVNNTLGFPVVLQNTATISEVQVTGGFVPYVGLGGTNTVHIAAGAGLLQVAPGAVHSIVLNQHP
jgi:hypothetical protein